VITPRRTRLIRAADLHEFRKAIGDVVRLKPDITSSSAVVVPTRAAAVQLARAFSNHGRPLLVTRDQLYDVLHSRLKNPPARLNAFEREALAQAAADEAVRDTGSLPFQIRPGLVSEMLRFYDQLRRQSQHVTRFDELMTTALEGDSTVDRGAERLLAQTRFLVAAFREYERRVAASGACDEHVLRERLVAGLVEGSLKHIVITVADWIADPAGLFVADFDLLSRIPGLESLDLVCTSAVLGSGFHERIHNWWPGLEETDAGGLIEAEAAEAADLKVRTTSDLTVRASAGSRVRPVLALPTTDPERVWFTYRDREEELVAVADRLQPAGSSERPAWDRTAIVFKHPLPYLYLAPGTLGAASIPYQIADALPLAAEPLATTVDLVLDAVETAFSRDSLVALLRSPHLDLHAASGISPRSISELNHALSDRRYLGGLDRLESFAASLEGENETDSARALAAALAVARELAPLAAARPASEQVRGLMYFLQRHFRSHDEDDPFSARERSVREALLNVLGNMATARELHHDAAWSIDDLAAAVRRWIGDETFPVQSDETGVHLLDDQAARYGDFVDMTIVGLVENEWPERPRRNIFYPPGLLKSLGWASEKDRRAADEARFLDLLASASTAIALSTFTLDDESIVSRSILLDEVPRAHLSSVVRLRPDATNETVVRLKPDATDERTEWARLRAQRTAPDAAIFHGAAGPGRATSWSVSALETYTTCPFKFFAQHVLKLEEEPDDEEVMDPRRQGQFVHHVFEKFFGEWQAAGHRAITSANLDQARALFTDVVDRALTALPEGEAGLERTRLLGSSAAAGLGEAVFRMEAERPVPVIERLLEHELRGSFTIATNTGSREVHLRGKADRVDLLDDGTFRLIDYKLGWPPDRTRALQLPVYSVCAEQRLAGRHGRQWKLGEAMYLAFKGPKRVVPLFASTANRDEVLDKAQQRLADTIDAIARGEFPPTPDDVYRCETCSFAAVCRKDYVGDV
jgi:RecB family exonuclease